MGYVSLGQPVWFWKDRIRVDPWVNTRWNINLQNYIDNLFDFSLSVKLSVYKSLEITFSSNNNTRTYLVFPGLPGPGRLAVGEPPDRPLESLTSPTSRPARSGFKIQSLALKVVHHLPDWDVTVQYTGSRAVSGRQIRVGPQLCHHRAWVAVPQVKSNIKGDYTGVTLR